MRSLQTGDNMAKRSELINGILNRLASAENFNDISWILGETVITATRKYADAITKSNVTFQGESGLSPVLKRIPLGGCCEWCQNKAGVYYNYPFPDELYKRHRNCRCSILFDTRTSKSGSVTNASTKETFDTEVEALEQSLKDYNLTKKDTWDYYKSIKESNTEGGKIWLSGDVTTTLEQFGKKIGKHGSEWGLDPSSSLDRSEFYSIIKNVLDSYDEIRSGFWRGQGENCLFYIKDEDVVITKDNNFVTILKDGINNARVKNAGK